MNFVSHERCLGRGLVLDMVVCQVFHVHDSADALAGVGDHLSHLASVEAVTSGPNAVQAVPSGSALGLNQLPQGASQGFLHQKASCLGQFAVVVEHVCATWGIFVELGNGHWRLESVQHVVVVRNAALGVLDGRRENLSDALGTVPLQQRQIGVDNAGQGKGQVRQRAGACGYFVLTQ